MLSLRREHFTGELRVYLRTPPGEAWIAPHPRRSSEQRINRQMWVRSKPGLPARTGKSLRRLAIESELRS